MEVQLLTQKLERAETEYRAAVRRLRELGQKVETIDSTHITDHSVGADSDTPDYVQMMKSRHDFDVAVWRAGLRPDALESAISVIEADPALKNARLRAPGSVIGIDGGVSVENAPTWGTGNAAKRSRAWARMKARRDHKAFARRKRRAESPEVHSSAGSVPAVGAAEKPRRQHLSNHRFGFFPQGPATQSFEHPRAKKFRSFRSNTAT